MLSLLGMNIGGGDTVSDSGELWVIDYFGRQLSQYDHQAIVFDVGANGGDWAQAVVSRLGKKIMLYCFEPSRMAFEILASNLGNYEKVKIFNFGFGDKEGCAKLYSNAPGSGLGSIYDRRLDHFGINMSHTEEIHLRTIDDFCLNEGVQRIDFLKLDVEGHELYVLNGAKSLIVAHSIDFIQFEFGGCNIDSRTYLQDFYYLLNQYYRIYRVLRNGLAPLRTYKETYENFITTNYLAISRKMR